MMKMIVVRYLLLVLGCVIVPNNMWGFELVSTFTPLTVYHSQNEADVVHTAVNLFIADMEAVSGQLPVKTDLLKNARLLIGTLAHKVPACYTVRHHFSFPFFGQQKSSGG